MKLKVVLIVGIFFWFLLTLNLVQAQTDDVTKIVYKLKGMDSLIDPPDTRSVKEIYESLSLQKKSELLTRVVDETLTRNLWDQIQTNQNKKELIKAGLGDQKSKELLDVWDKVREERDFIIQKMDELSENDEKNKQGFNKFTKDYIQKQNPGKLIDFEWKDLNRYFLDYFEQSADPEKIEVNYDNGLNLIVPLKDLPTDLKKIEVGATQIVYYNNNGGKLVVNVTKIYPKDAGTSEKWEIINFKDLEQNDYEVFIYFGESLDG